MTNPPDPNHSLPNIPPAPSLTAEPVSLAELATRLVESNDHLQQSVTNLIRKLSVRTYTFVALLTADAILTIAIGFFGYRYETVSACQATQNHAFKAAIIARNDAAATERAAQRALLDTTTKVNATDAQKRAAVTEYYAGLVAADQQRDANPLPVGNCS